MSAPGQAARKAGAEILHGVLLQGKMLSEVLGGEDSPLKDLEPRDRARAQTIATGVLRHLEPIDAVLDHFLEKSPPFKVRNALRIAGYELLAEGVPAHAGVDAAVRLVQGSRKTRHLSGLTNAVARKIATEGLAMWPTLPPQHLPKWLAAPLSRAYGPEALAGIEAAHAEAPPLDLTLTSPTTAAQWAETLGAEQLPTGSLRLRQAGQVSALPGFDEGAWWVQDAAAAVPASLLGDVNGLEVLDLCAAPGGKTLQLAASGARVTAVDVSAERLQRLQQNLDRVVLEAKTIDADVMHWQPGTKFDAILLDAPCSATGTLRRHPDLPFAKTGDIGGLIRLQRRMLARALDWLKPGGRLVYCTCSLLPAEGEDQVAAVLAERSDITRQPVAGLPAEWLTSDGDLRLRPDFWPERGGMDGFFAAILRKDQNAE